MRENLLAPWRRSSVMILVVWFQVLSIKTTLWIGQVRVSEAAFNLFTLCAPPAEKYSHNSSTVIASGPGNTSTICGKNRHLYYPRRSEHTAGSRGFSLRFLRSGPTQGCRGTCRWWRRAARGVWPAPPCSCRLFHWGVWWCRSSPAAENGRQMFHEL